MLVLFGWMDLLIICKWLIPWQEGGPKETNISYSPSIISLLIAMFLNMGAVDEDVETYIIGSNSTQKTINNILLVIFLLCIPVMLLVKPLVLRSRMQNAHP